MGVVGKAVQVLKKNTPIFKNLSKQKGLKGKIGKKLTYRNVAIGTAANIAIAAAITKLNQKYAVCFSACDKMYLPRIAAMASIPVIHHITAIPATPLSMYKTNKTKRACLLSCRLTREQEKLKIYTDALPNNPKLKKKIIMTMNKIKQLQSQIQVENSKNVQTK